MKSTLAPLAILVLGVSVAVAAPDFIDKGGFGSSGESGRYIFYTQTATGGPYYLYGANASVAFDSEVADDIPAGLAGHLFNQIGIYGVQWGAPGITPNGLYIRIYGGDCPPDQAANTTYYFYWFQMNTVDQNDPNYWIYYIQAMLPVPLQITDGMSIGFQMDCGTWQGAPYAGILTVDLVYGCGSAYRDGYYWGHLRWTSFSSLGYDYDLPYSLGLLITASEASNWSSVKALY